MPKKVNVNECIGCGSCAGDCPVFAIKLTEVATINESECIDCGVCINNCPVGAIVESNNETTSYNDSEDYNNLVKRFMDFDKEVNELIMLVSPYVEDDNITEEGRNFYYSILGRLGDAGEKMYDLLDASVVYRKDAFICSLKGSLMEIYDILDSLVEVLSSRYSLDD